MFLPAGMCTWYDSAAELCGISLSNDLAVFVTV